MFHHPAWAVDSCSSGTSAAETVGTKSAGCFNRSEVSPSSNLLESLPQGAQVPPAPRAAAALHLPAVLLSEDGRRPHARGRREPRGRDAAGGWLLIFGILLQGDCSGW